MQFVVQPEAIKGYRLLAPLCACHVIACTKSRVYTLYL